MTRAPTRVQRSTQRQVGDVCGSWTLVKLLEDAPSSHLRRWLVECKCGWTSKKYESDTTPSKMGACYSCAKQAVVQKQKQEKNDANQG